jgi:CHAT domain
LPPVPLERLTLRSVRENVADFLASLDEIPMSAAAQRRIVAMLGWLWDVIAEPVLERLRVSGPPTDEEWPRVWWCVSGLLSFLPLHAAGHHHTRSDTVPKIVADRFISSYTPTIRSLAYSRRALSTIRRDIDAADPGKRMLVVAMPHTRMRPIFPVQKPRPT